MGVTAARFDREAAYGTQGKAPSRAVLAADRSESGLDLHLLNLDEIAAAYGQGAALAAVDHVKCFLNFELRDLDAFDSADYVLRQLSEVPVAYDGQRFHLFVSLAPTGGTKYCAHKVTPTVHGNPAFPDDAWCRRYRADMALAVTLFEAMAEDRLLLAFQPVRHAEEDGRVLYHECLLRMQGAEADLFAVGPHIEALERLGLIRALDRFVFEAVLEQLRTDPLAHLAVNISAKSLVQDEWWSDHLRALADQSGLARRLYVEITETSALASVSDAVSFCQTLRGLGCRIVLDDFGIGHAAIRSILALSPEVVKIDKFFLRNATTSKNGWRALAHLVGMVDALGPLTVVEGVEDARSSALLLGMGVQWQQGWHLGRPSMSRFGSFVPLGVADPGRSSATAQRVPLELLDHAH